MRKVLLLLATAVAFSPWAAGQVPTPEAFLGYDLGSRFTPHHRVTAYFERVAAASERVELRSYGTTYEGRELLLAFVSSPANLARREAIREDHLRQAGLVDGEPQGDETAIVWLSYGVHGNESVSTEAAMATLFTLATGGDRLDSTIVIIDPCINPDGRERYVQWYNRAVGTYPDADPAAVEHDEPSPGGRGNHYLFDLNRDWSWFSQRETRARVSEYNRWLPHVHVDFHEQGVDSPYFFAPAVEPYHPAVTDWQRRFQEYIGENNARVFDRNGWLFFTRESFDLFYPGYGDTYPTFNGAIGMTYEQAGSGRAGLGIRTAAGDTLRLTDRIAHHYATGLSTVETASRHRKTLVAEFARYFGPARGAYAAFVVHASSGADRLSALAEHLDRLGIGYGSVARGTTARGFDYRTATAGPVRVEPGDLVVSVDQPKARLVSVLFEPDAALSDSSTYDITAWALPYAYGLDAHALETVLRPDAPFDGPSRSSIQGPVRPPPPVAMPAEKGPPTAWAAPWGSPADARLLARLLMEGVKARVATEAFEIDGVRHAAGTLVFTRADNRHVRPDLASVLRAAEEETGRSITPLSSGRVTSGRDVGSSSMRLVEAPRILVAFGDGGGSTSAGEVWHWFDERIRYRTTRVSVETLGSIDLAEWDVLILPSGSYGALVDGEGMNRLRGWVESGGRIIALDRAVRSFAGKDGFALKAPERDDEGDADPGPKRYGDRLRARIPDAVTGAVFAAQVDATHPLGFGLERGYFALRMSSTAYGYMDKDGAWNVGVVPKGGRRAGFVGSNAAPRMEETLSFGVEEAGRGAFVYLVDNPLFRAFWYEGDLLFANAVFMPLR